LSAAARAGRPRDRGARPPMKILVMNWHEPYLALLGRVGHEWIVGDWFRPWNAAYRPLPSNFTRCADEAQARAWLADRAIDAVVTQTPRDLAWVGDTSVPIVHLAHNVPENELDAPVLATGDDVRAFVAERVAGRGAFVTISPMKRERWGLDGEVILPGVDV